MAGRVAWFKAHGLTLAMALGLTALVVLAVLFASAAISSATSAGWSFGQLLLLLGGLACLLPAVPLVLRLVHVSGRGRYAAKAIEASGDGYWILDLDGNFVDVNDSYCRMMGFGRDEVMTMSIADFEAVAKTEQIQAQLRRIMASGQENFETRHRHRNGDWVDLQVRATGVDGRHIVALLRNVSDRKRSDATIHHLAFFDALTGLPNRRLLQDRIEQALVSSARNGLRGAVVFIDLDNFKLVNDSCGHEAGDQLLKKAGDSLRAAVRLGDTVARQGGDEFVLVLEGLRPDPVQAATQAESIAEKCRAALEQPFVAGSHEFFVTASVGVAMFRGDAVPFGVLLQRADTAMYQAKFGGRNRVVFFEPEMQRGLAMRTQTEADLRRALPEQQFELYLQPLVDLSGKLLGAEMLLRWQHPHRGLLVPADFLPLAEETGLILPIDAWVLASACAHLALWQAQPKLRHLRLGVNISSTQFLHAGFVDDLAALLAQHGFDPANLTLELSEKLVNKDLDAVAAKVARIKGLGVSMSMDNFGTGLSSLTNLRRLPLRQLKIDQSFIRNISVNPDDMIVVRTIVAMAAAMGLEVVAEGVESETTRALLAQNGCGAYQGYLFSPPLPLQEFESRVRTGWSMEAAAPEASAVQD
jgi:diguanylate cyclase (GGDEF)-like protein/PAS domain S-box-containing protein